MKRQLLLPFSLFLGAAVFFAPWIQGQDVDAFGRPMWIFTPKPQISVSASATAENVVRQARSEMFNSPTALRSSAQDLTQPNTLGIGSGHFDDFSVQESLPVKSSDAIVLGIVQGTQPYLSGDHTKIYSELLLIPDDILKDSSNQLANGHPAVILASGGSIKFPNGQVATTVSAGGSSPINLGKHYLLFLHYEHKAEAYTVLKAWDLSNGQPQELNLNGRPSRRITEDSNHTTTQESLVALVKSRIDSK